MTKLIENTKQFKGLREYIEAITGANTEGVERVIIKLDRNNQIISAGDCYIIKGDRNGSKEED